LVEILPRFLVSPARDFKEFDLIVRGKVPETITSILSKFEFHSIISLNDAEAVEVERLIMVTDLRYADAVNLIERKDELTKVRSFLMDDQYLLGTSKMTAREAIICHNKYPLRVLAYQVSPPPWSSSSPKKCALRPSVSQT
jgi:hypothetical protein